VRSLDWPDWVEVRPNPIFGGGPIHGSILAVAAGVIVVGRQALPVCAKAGGFGVVLAQCFDYSEQPELWQRSMRLLVDEVLPRVGDLEPAPQAELTATPATGG
jgi:hypothetical protein